VLLAGVFALGPMGPAHADTVRVRAVFDGSYVWRPRTKSIVAGTTVRWKAIDGNHTIRSRGTNWSFSANLAQGTSVTRTFNHNGTFRYYCTIHGSVANGVCTGMCGKIVVG
jgi:plastocyanin